MTQFYRLNNGLYEGVLVRKLKLTRVLTLALILRRP